MTKQVLSPKPVRFLALFMAVLCLLPALPAAAAAEKKEEVKQASIVMVGDVLMHKKVVNTGLQEDGTYSFDHLFAPVKDVISGADIAIVNQETIMGGKELGGFSGFPTFNSPYALADAEAAAGFDVVLQGTNHALDKGARGIENCLTYWETNHPEIPVLGIHNSAEDQAEVCILEVNDMRIAVLNYTYGTNGIQMPKGKGYLVDYLQEARVRTDLAFAESNSDFTIVCPHWGTEYSHSVSGEQRKWAEVFYEGGADLVIGTHPHVIEPVEWISGEDGRAMLVYYSLGNYINSTATWKKGVMNRFIGGMASVTLKKEDGKVSISAFGVLPLITHIQDGSITTYFLSSYTEEMAKANRVHDQDPGFSLENARALVNEVWPGL